MTDFTIAEDFLSLDEKQGRNHFCQPEDLQFLVISFLLNWMMVTNRLPRRIYISVSIWKGQCYS